MYLEIIYRSNKYNFITEEILKKVTIERNPVNISTVNINNMCDVDPLAQTFFAQQKVVYS